MAFKSTKLICKPKLRWLTNTGKDFDFKWLSDKVIGDPKATDFYTVKQLKDMGMIGIYVKG